MIASEIKNNKTTVRIHDTYCSNPTEGCLSRANQIVCDAYTRRTAEANVVQTKE